MRKHIEIIEIVTVHEGLRYAYLVEGEYLSSETYRTKEEALAAATLPQRQLETDGRVVPSGSWGFV